jgi:nicotinate-nucleotide adenylyltransferase
MKIGIYGGSFDPPHLGHLNVVLHALNSCDLDKVWVIPCFQQTGKNLTDFWDRYTMCRRMFDDLPNVHVLDVEERLGGESLTVRTIKYLKNRQDDEMFLIVGQDTADRIPQWEGGAELMQLVKLRIAPRTNISSTEIRKDRNEAFDKCSMSVCRFIYDTGLYQ